MNARTDISASKCLELDTNILIQDADRRTQGEFADAVLVSDDNKPLELEA